MARKGFTIEKGKTCPSCKDFKDPIHFGTRARADRVYLSSWCRDCTRVKARSYQRIHYKKNSYASWKYNIKKNYGLSVEEYERMLLAQQGVCRICKREQARNRRLAVDHCHKTGLVRGLLCDECNHGIGNFQDRLDLLKAAIDYLQESR